jgi:hypothetical protein
VIGSALYADLAQGRHQHEAEEHDLRLVLVIRFRAIREISKSVRGLKEGTFSS